MSMPTEDLWDHWARRALITRFRLARRKRVAFGLADIAQNYTDIWVHDLTQKTTNRFTFNPAVDDVPVWSPDGTRIVWSSLREGGADLYQRASNLADDETALLKSPEPKFPQDWSSDGRFLMYSVNRGDRGGTNLDLWLLPLQGEQKTTQFLGTSFTESQWRFFPGQPVRCFMYRTSPEKTRCTYVSFHRAKKPAVSR